MPEAGTLAMRDPRIGPRVALVAGFLAFAGVPLYIHLPRFAAELGIPLATIGLLLLALRVMDFVQDPALGWLAERVRDRRPLLAALALGGMGTGFAAVFWLQPGVAGLAAALVLVFTAYSLGTILFYAQGAVLVGSGESGGHYRLAGWREAGALAGIVAAAMLPVLLAAAFGPLGGYAGFGLVLALAAPLVWQAGMPLWSAAPGRVGKAPRLSAFRQAGALPLLVLALLDALPVAVTSTLFLFFVEDRLALPGLAGPFLVLFFLSAGVTAPLWSRLAERFGAKRVLLPAMTLALFAFAGASVLPEGAALAFGAICIVSGAAVGADLVILPALFAATLSRARLPEAIGFGAWSFANKAALALAAGVVLPLLDVSGYVPGQDNGPEALATLNAAYALLPLALKLPAVAMVARLPGEVR
ncbi:MFS transporter [Halovulum sp. GXIMD14794]